jgi:hypothetical protein
MNTGICQTLGFSILKMSTLNAILEEVKPTCASLSPNLRTPEPGVHSPFYITDAGGEPWVEPWVWRPEMWAQVKGWG